jgi:phospholipid/cholesterol/gamma-HCH transport system substrate-binding protein/paraquat-inducible protein B
MSAQANYLKIGAFILSALTITVMAIIVLSGGKWFKNFQSWETYFDESVQGLAVGSPIKYRGVQVGTVESIEFVNDVYGPELSEGDVGRYGHYVLVSGSAKLPRPNLPQEQREVERVSRISKGLRVRLASQGLTGLVYLEVDYMNPQEYPAPALPWRPRSFYVPSAPSTISVLGSALHNIAKDLEGADIHTIAKNLDTLVFELTKSVKEANVRGLSSQTSQVLAEFQAFARQARLLAESRDAQTILSEAARTVERARDMMTEWSQVAKQVKIASDRFPDTATRLERSVRRVDALLADKSSDIEDTIENLRVTAENLRELTDNAKRYPAQVFLGEPPPRAGPTKR